MTELNNIIESRENFVFLLTSICDKYKLDPSIESNIRNVRTFLQALDPGVIVRMSNSLEEANNYIIETYGKRIKATKRNIPEELTKMKTMMIERINRPGDDAENLGKAYSTFVNKKENMYDGSNNPFESLLDMPPEKRILALRFLNYQTLFRDEYIVIDSRYRNIVNTDSTKLDFALITNTKTRSAHGGVIVGNTLQDIIEIEIFPFTIPYKPVYATFYNKITLGINEWSSNAFEAYEGGQFHFEFDIERIDNNLIYLKPINNKYTFSTPVNRIDSFSLSFGAVYPKIAFDKDRMVPSNISFTDTLGLITFSEQHNLVTGDLIYISGFNTPDPARDVDMIQIVNRNEGHIIVKKDNYSFIINVDLSAVRHEVPIGSQIYPIDSFEQSISIFFASKRVQIQMRLGYLTSYA